MNVWAITNQKGGVGKTTTTVTLASILARRGARVLVVDLDPHGSLTSYLDADSKKSVTGIFNAFSSPEHNAHEHITMTSINGVSLYKSSVQLATLDRSIGGEDGMGLLLKKVLASVESRYDYALIDCPPILGVLMINALAACDFVIIPAQAEFLSLNGLDRMVDTLKMINKSVNNDLEYLIVPTMFDRRTRISSTSHALMKERFGEQLWRYVIPVDTMLREASQQGVSIIDLAPRSRAAIAYEQLVKDIVSRHKRDITIELMKEAV